MNMNGFYPLGTLLLFHGNVDWFGLSLGNEIYWMSKQTLVRARNVCLRPQTNETLKVFSVIVRD